MDEQFDVVVIGSGIGGLTAARLLAEFGSKRVLVLEQHYTLGGMMHEFTREARYHFNTGVHYLTAGPNAALAFLTDGQLQLRRLPDDYDILHFPGFDFAVPASAEAFRARLKARFPDEADAVDGFFKAVDRAARGTVTRHIVSALPKAVRNIAMPVVEWLFPDTFRSIRDVVARHFEEPAVRAIVSARWGLYGPPPGQSAFGGHAVVGLNGFSGGATHPVGGPKALGEAIISGLARFGVALRARQRVTGIAVQQGRATGVTVEDIPTGRSYTVAASAIVSAIGARNTARLLDPVVARPWRQAVQKLHGELGTLLLFIGFHRSPAELGLRGENHWFMPDLDDDKGVGYPLGDGILFCSFSSLNNPAARSHTAEVMHFVDPTLFAQWFGTEEASRPPEYHHLKAGLTERLLQRLEARWPGFRALVGFTELATPLSFITYQASAGGSFYGLPNSPDRLRSAVASSRTGVKHLHLAGQDAAGPGIEAALWGGVTAASAQLAGRQAARMWRSISSGPTERPSPWRGYLQATRIEPLSAAVVRVRLTALDGGELPFTFAAGQYVKLELPIGGDTIERSYSIASPPAARRYLDLAIKREPGGLGSGFLNAQLATGEALRVSGPHGDFTFAEPGGDPAGAILLIAGGIGITPLLSLVSAAADTGRTAPITLLASFSAGDGALFAAELETLSTRLPSLDVHFYGTATTGGRIDVETLRPHVAQVSRIHLCGPLPMMRAMLDALATLEVPRAIIHTEAFVSAGSRKTRVENGQAIAREAAAAGISTFAIGIGHGTLFPCPAGTTLLDAANAANIPFSQSCRNGECGKCRTRILAGPYLTDGQGLFSPAEVATGTVLACQTLPQADLEIELVGVTPVSPSLPQMRPGIT
jgi:all-trans-retinol 13,14-reductase